MSHGCRTPGSPLEWSFVNVYVSEQLLTPSESKSSFNEGYLGLFEYFSNACVFVWLLVCSNKIIEYHGIGIYVIRISYTFLNLYQTCYWKSSYFCMLYCRTLILSY